MVVLLSCAAQGKSVNELVAKKLFQRAWLLPRLPLGQRQDWGRYWAATGQPEVLGHFCIRMLLLIPRELADSPGSLFPCTVTVHVHTSLLLTLLLLQVC